jgi:hypothetical protein
MNATFVFIAIFAILGSVYNVDAFTVRSSRPVTANIRPALTTLRMSGEESSTKKRESTWDRITGPKLFKVSEIQYSLGNIDMYTIFTLSHHKATTLSDYLESVVSNYKDGDKLAGDSFRATSSSQSDDRALDDSPRLRGYAPLAF